MRLLTVLLLVGVMVVLCAIPASAATIHVPADQPTIDAGMNFAGDGDTVLVAPGVYGESLASSGKALVLLSQAGPDSTTIIPVFNGITINGSNDGTFAVIGFAIRGMPTDESVVLTSSNSTDTIVIQNCRFYSNAGDVIACNWRGRFVIQHSLFDHNISEDKSAMFFFGEQPASGSIIHDNTFVCGAFGLFGTLPSDIRNNIFAFNTRSGVSAGVSGVIVEYNDAYSNGIPDYVGVTVGMGNINADPRFVDTATSDFRLLLTSPCVDAGDPSPVFNDGDGSRNDIGAYGSSCNTSIDTDCDGAEDLSDNCPTIANANQADSDGDGSGDGCDNCPGDYNPSQTDTDSDGIGDICDACLFDAQNDADGDGICGNVDNCPTVSNANQADADGDGRGDVCDNCPTKFNPAQEETDGDGIADSCDNCPTVFNASQTDVDGDGIGNACDACLTDPLNDSDNDGVCHAADNCPTVYNPDQADTNGNSIGDVCDCACQCHADPVCDSVWSDIVDVVSTVNVAFRNGLPITDPSATCPREATDVDCSGGTDVIDVVKVVNVAFRNASGAMEYCEPCP